MADGAPKSSLSWLGPLLGGLAALATAGVAIYREIKSDDSQSTRAPAVVIESFSARPAQIAPGQAAVLNWQSEHAEACNLEPAVGGVGVNGSRSVKPEVDTTYWLRCQGAGGEIERSVSISVVAPAELAPAAAEPAPAPARPQEPPPNRIREAAMAENDPWADTATDEDTFSDEELMDLIESATQDSTTPALAYHCCDINGLQRCPLVSPVPVGTPCFCPYQGTGISCP